MSFKNSIKILLSQFRLVWVVMLYMIILTLVMIGICLPLLAPIVQLLTENSFANFMSSIYTSIFAGVSPVDIIIACQVFVSNLTTIIVQNDHLIVNVILLWVACTIVYRFLLGLYELPLLIVIESKMSSNAKLSFRNSFVASLGKSSRFVLLKMIYTLVFDFALMSLLVLEFRLSEVAVLVSFVPLIMMITFIIMSAVRYMLINAWAPAMVVEGKPLLQSFKENCTSKVYKRANILSLYAVMWLLIMVVNLFVALFSFGAGLLLTIPLSMVFSSLLQMTIYYNSNGRRYYTDDSFVTPPQLAS